MHAFAIFILETLLVFSDTRQPKFQVLWASDPIRASMNLHHPKPTFDGLSFWLETFHFKLFGIYWVKFIGSIQAKPMNALNFLSSA